MSKQKPNYKFGDDSIISVIQQNLTKNGKIRGKNKKQTKILKGACVHHHLKKNDRNKKKATLEVNKAQNICRCRMCSESFRGTTYTKEEIKEIMKPFKSANSQAKYLSVAVGGGNEAVRYFSELGAMLALYPKNYRKVANVAEKKDKVKGKKKKKNHSDSEVLGSWQ